MSKTVRRKTGQFGCGFMLASGLVIILLLVLNGAFVRIFFAANFARIDERIFHAAQFVLPIVMIAIEFWIYDQIVNRKKMPGKKD